MAMKKVLNSFRFTTRNIAFMATLLALYSVIKYFSFLVFKGPLNINIELLFWIFNGIMFTPVKGVIFSMVCDLAFCFMTSGIAYWMIEYAIIPPLVTLTSFFFWKFYRENSTSSIIFSVVIFISLIIFSLIVFFFQLISSNFRYEGSQYNEILPSVIYFLIVFFCVSMIAFLIFSLFMYKKTKDWKYIKRLYFSALLILIFVIFRWLWGPYAYLEFSRRFYSKSIDFKKQYPLSLFGIVSKSYLTIPISLVIVVPMVFVLEKFRMNNIDINRF